MRIFYLMVGSGLKLKTEQMVMLFLCWSFKKEKDTVKTPVIGLPGHTLSVTPMVRCPGQART